MIDKWTKFKFYLSEITGGVIGGGLGGLMVGPALIPLADTESGIVEILPLYFIFGALIGAYLCWQNAKGSIKNK